MTRVISSRIRWKRTRTNTKMTFIFLRGNQMILLMLSHTIIRLIQVWNWERVKMSWRKTCWILIRKRHIKELIIFGPPPREGVKRRNLTTERIWVHLRTDINPTRSLAFLAMTGFKARRGFIKFTRPQICRKFHTSLIALNIDLVTNLMLIRAQASRNPKLSQNRHTIICRTR